MKHVIGLVASCAAAVLGCSSQAGNAGSGEPVAMDRQAVSLDGINDKQFAIANDNSVPVHATGAVFIPFLDSDGSVQTVSTSSYGDVMVRGSCGVTFVSPHYAITASHCFSNYNVPNPASQTFGVWSYDVTNANVFSFYFDSMMQGTFPDYSPIFGQIVNQVPGYTASGYTCSIASRCPVQAGVDTASGYNCDGVDAPDITMLYCSDRPRTSAWLGIADDPATTAQVPLYMYWFHELFTPQASNADMATHYTEDHGFIQNWHYLGAPSNILLPLMSTSFSTGVLRQRYGAGADSDVRTDLYGCHGTSGSGVLEWNPSTQAYELLGPVHQGGSAWAGSKLCDDPTLLVPGGSNGQHGLTYSSNTSVNNLVNAIYNPGLLFDRIIRRR